MANEKANAHSELLPENVGVNDIVRTSTNTASGNKKMFWSKIFAYLMVKSVYDSNGNGVVDNAENANTANTAGNAGEAATLSVGQTANAIMQTDGAGVPTFVAKATLNSGVKRIILIRAGSFFIESPSSPINIIGHTV